MIARLPLAIAAALALIPAAGAFGATSPPAATPFKIGALQAYAVRDGEFALPNNAKTFGVDVGAAEVAKVLQGAGMATDKIPVAIDALLVKTGGHVVLMDTGYGSAGANQLVASLKLAGVEPGQVTDILITHSHGDHIGGLATDGVLVFPAATIRMATKEWAWMQSQTQNADVVKAIAAKVKTFEPGAEVVPGITAVALDGHTPGHVGYEVHSGKARLLDVGDLVHSSVISLAKPEWTMGFDNDKAQGKITRRAELTALAKSGEPIFTPHFPYPGVGRVAVQGEGFVWKPGLP